VTDRNGLPPLHLQLAGPAARPHGHPDHAFVLDQLAIGEYPTPEDAGWLRTTLAVTVVINLQDDIDLERKGLTMRGLQEAYAQFAIRFFHLPIADGDGDALRRRLDDAVALLGGLISAGERVYLHCNAGLNRAPTVAIAYLHAHGGHSLETACSLVKARRPCVPYMRVLHAHYGTACSD
jgi:protein-tyrosine phosphatase